MAVEYVNREDLDDAPLTGGQLRQKLEDALKSNRELAAKVHTYTVKDTLAAGGFQLVRPEDLNGVPLERVEERAKEIETTRQTEQQELLRKALVSRGFDEATIEQIVEDGALPAADPGTASIGRIRGLANIGEGTPAKDPALANLAGRDLMRHHFETQERKAVRRRA